MASFDGQQLYRRLECDFDVAKALPAGRAALGLMAVLRCWVGGGNNRQVALPAIVCHDVVAAVLGAGCEPVFCDINSIDGSVPESEWVRARAVGASVALIVHLYGNPFDISVVRRHFRSPDCLIVDDAAQALGSKNADGPVGGQGDVGLISFGISKHIEVGGAAILFKNSMFADKVDRLLASYSITPEEQRSGIHNRFCKHFEVARRRLRTEGDKAAVDFHGLLDKYFLSLYVPFPVRADLAACLALDNYLHSREQRILKATTWGVGLKDSGLVPIGMGVDTVPWRYACRLPGIDWAWQHRLGEAMRSHGLNVSHWYLPAPWLCGYGAGIFPEAERLAREVFQFWVDERTSFKTIERGIAIVSAIIEEFNLQKQKVDDVCTK